MNSVKTFSAESRWWTATLTKNLREKKFFCALTKLTWFTMYLYIVISFSNIKVHETVYMIACLFKFQQFLSFLHKFACYLYKMKCKYYKQISTCVQIHFKDITHLKTIHSHNRDNNMKNGPLKTKNNYFHTKSAMMGFAVKQFLWQSRHSRDHHKTQEDKYHCKFLDEG